MSRQEATIVTGGSNGIGAAIVAARAAAGETVLNLDRDQPPAGAQGETMRVDLSDQGALGEVMDLSPSGIRRQLDLNKPIYARTAAYGHFGREPDAEGGFSWEKTDLVEALKKAV